MAVTEAGSYSSNSTPNLGTSICHKCGHKRKKKEKCNISKQGRLLGLLEASALAKDKRERSVKGTESGGGGRERQSGDAGAKKGPSRRRVLANTCVFN